MPCPACAPILAKLPPGTGVNCSACGVSKATGPSEAVKLLPHAYEDPLTCRQCGGVAEEARRVYVTPVCYSCLPPPEPLATIKVEP